MADIPDGMLQKERQEDQRFVPDEWLYRRFSPDMLDGDEVAMDAIPLPDMSVNRSKYGPPEWTLISLDDDLDFSDWGVARFAVSDLPSPMTHLGIDIYTFKAVHVPLRRNNCHAEVQAFKNDVHIAKSHPLDPEVHLRFRNRLAERMTIAIQPRRL